MGASIRESVKDLAYIGVGYLVVSVVFEALGITLAALNTSTANTATYIPASLFGSGAATLIPIINIVFLLMVIYTLLEVFGAGNIFNLG
jgi:hypothetical protein